MLKMLIYWAETSSTRRPQQNHKLTKISGYHLRKCSGVKRSENVNKNSIRGAIRRKLLSAIPLRIFRILACSFLCQLLHDAVGVGTVYAKLTGKDMKDAIV
jgi:hypothetical protein